MNELRSIYERMTNPTPDDLRVQDRVQGLTRVDLQRIVDHLAQALEHLGKQRKDMHVQTTRDGKATTIRIELE